MQNPNYSIIIPTHNSSRFIGKLLESIPERSDLEVIIVDDHSEDYKMLERGVAGHPFVRLYSNTNGRGAGNARQIGLEMARGKWIVFADSDDYFTDRFSGAMERYKDSDADIVLLMARAEKLDKSKSNRCDYYHYLFNQWRSDSISDLELSCRLTNIWAKFYRREAVTEASFQDTLVANDVQYAAQAAFYTRKSIFIDDDAPSYILMERPDSITTSRHKKISKYVKRLSIRIANDRWLSGQLKKAGEGRVRLRRHESVFRKFIMKGAYEAGN